VTRSRREVKRIIYLAQPYGPKPLERSSSIALAQPSTEAAAGATSKNREELPGERAVAT